ncbi:hypothetical protein OBBRIDRAFT_795435 [Obba rivulosa]|uniref:Mitochondrial adapter protein MCP1 transmembrane domain-containing protein n=1 Tax=Obba rivulosa TaxID=1052685 RepID=A0A8E2ARZ4_9APHY|nr:hypothetical protein OBBRIDRAFT_795435 [Obba rivulosa]
MAAEPAGKPEDNTTSIRRSLQTLLTKISHGSAPFITTFLLIHLSAPILANIGGSSLASQVMILGREYYQTSFGEKYLVLAPLVVHPCSSILKRLLAPKPARRLSSILSLTAYAAVLIVPLHFLIHRVYPADPLPPVDAVGPAELDYEFVKAALNKWPWRSWLAYIALTTCVAWHAAEGMSIIWNTWLKGTTGNWKSGAKRRAVAAVLTITPVLTGIFVMAREPPMVFASTAARYHAAMRKLFYYRL